MSTVMLGRTMRDVLRPEMDRALLRVRIEQMRTPPRRQGPGRHPAAGRPRSGRDGLGARAPGLLGRTRATAPLLSFGRMTRPENLAMVEALEIEVDQVTPEELRAYDALAMVDIQPTFCEEAPAPGRGRHRPSSGGEGVARALPGRATDVRRHVDDHDRVSPGGRGEDHRAGRDSALLRHQDRHAPPRAERYPGGHGRLRVPLRDRQSQHPPPDRAPRTPAGRPRRAGRRPGPPDDHPERPLRPPRPRQPAGSDPAVRGSVPPGQGHRVVGRLRV